VGFIRGARPHPMPCSGTAGRPQRCLAGSEGKAQSAGRLWQVLLARGFPHGINTREMPRSVPGVSLRHRNMRPARARPQRGHPQQRDPAPLAAAPGQPARAAGFYSSGGSRWILSCYKHASFYSPCPGPGLVPAALSGGEG